MSPRPALHVQNIFDAFNPLGTGVTGALKLKSLQLQNRVVALADARDVIAISADCPPAYVEYMLATVGAPDVLCVRYDVSGNLSMPLDATAVFQGLANSDKWDAVKRRGPLLNPHFRSAATYTAARKQGLVIPDAEWQTVVCDRLYEVMGDKANFYAECVRERVPVPRHWVADGQTMPDRVIDLLAAGVRPLHIRQTRSGGALGSVTVDQHGSSYSILESRAAPQPRAELLDALKELAANAFSPDFVIAEMLDVYASPGTLFFADEEKVTVVCHTRQILSTAHVFVGFSYPIEDELITQHFDQVEKWVHRLVEPWRIRGFRGYGNIDWMVTKDGAPVLAERNARQTDTVAPLRIAEACAGMTRTDAAVVAPPLSLRSCDTVDLGRAATFEDVYATLAHADLLWKGERREGIVVTLPPLPRREIATVGLVAIAGETGRAEELSARAADVLGSPDG